LRATIGNKPASVKSPQVHDRSRARIREATAIPTSKPANKLPATVVATPVTSSEM
jgi:hypothetical protein